MCSCCACLRGAGLHLAAGSIAQRAGGLLSLDSQIRLSSSQSAEDGSAGGEGDAAESVPVKSEDERPAKRRTDLLLLSLLRYFSASAGSLPHV